jgi:hypothetical protein
VVVNEGVFDGNMFQPFRPGKDRLVHDHDSRLVVIKDLDWLFDLEAKCRMHQR